MWHTLTPEESAQRLTANSATGLTSAEVQRRLAQHGPNELIGRGGRNRWAIVWGQLTGTLVVVLILAWAR